jgi:hypothetical protein
VPQLEDISASDNGVVVPAYQGNYQDITYADTDTEAFDFGKGLYVLDAIDAAAEAKVRDNL